MDAFLPKTLDRIHRYIAKCNMLTNAAMKQPLHVPLSGFFNTWLLRAGSVMDQVCESKSKLQDTKKPIQWHLQSKV